MIESTSPPRPHSTEIASFTPATFRERLVNLHNELVPEQPVADFDADKNVMGKGQAVARDGVAIRYPRRSDKEELLSYAVEKAQQCEDPGNGALLLAASVVAIHPFLEGNGRISRTLYRDLMGEKHPDEGKLKREFGSGTEGRESTDLGTAFTEDWALSSLSGNYPYRTNNILQDDIKVVVHKKGVQDDIQATALSEDALDGASDEERQDLVTAIGANEYGNTYAKDDDGLSFAANLITQRYPELQQLVTERETWKVINIHELLPQLSGKQKGEFVEALWEYRKLRAKSVIDFLSDDIGRQHVALDTGRVALRDLVIERTNNLHASKAESKL